MKASREYLTQVHFVLPRQSEVSKLTKQYKVKLQDKVNGPDAWKVRELVMPE